MARGKRKRLVVHITYDEGEREGKYGPVPNMLPEGVMSIVRNALQGETCVVEIELRSVKDEA